MKPQVRFFKSFDGAAIAYTVTGAGPALAKGFEEPVRVYEVRWRE